MVTRLLCQSYIVGASMAGIVSRRMCTIQEFGETEKSPGGRSSTHLTALIE